MKIGQWALSAVAAVLLVTASADSSATGIESDKGDVEASEPLAGDPALILDSAPHRATRYSTSPRPPDATLLEPGQKPSPSRGRWGELPRLPEAGGDDTAIDEAQLARLRAIGYVGGSIQTQRSGVAVHEARAAGPGLNFYTSGHAAEAVLMTMEGEVLHRWRYDFLEVWPDSKEGDNPGSQWWRRAYLFENGDILAIFGGLGIIKLDRESRLLWANPIQAHHDVAVMPNGDIYTLNRRLRSWRRDEDVSFIDDLLTILDADGRAKRNISIFDALWSSPYRDLIFQGHQRRSGDLFHTNTLFVLDDRLADVEPAFREGNVLISMNALGVIGVLDLESEKITWAHRVAKGDPHGQHDPQVLDNGRILLFDNRPEGDEFSSVTEIDPTTRDEHWSYRGSAKQPFFSRTCGTVQRLANGNTLITESDNGRAFEVTREGRTVWEFYNPHRAGSEEQYIAAVSQMLRLPAEHASGWLP